MTRLRSSAISCVFLALCCGCAASDRRVPDDPAAAFQAAETLRLADSHRAAARAFADFARAFDYDRRAHVAQFRAGTEYLLAHQYDAALNAFEKLHREFRYSWHLVDANALCYGMGVDLLKAGDAKGVTFLEHVCLYARHGDWAHKAHVALGQHYLALGRFFEAQLEFQSALAEHSTGPDGVTAGLLVARSEYKQIDRPARNMDHLEAARHRLKQLSGATTGTKDHAAVKKHLADIAELGAERHLLMTRFYLRQGAVAPALAHLDEVIRRYGASVQRWPAAGEVQDLILKETAKAPK